MSLTTFFNFLLVMLLHFVKRPDGTRNCSTSLLGNTLGSTIMLLSSGVDLFVRLQIEEVFQFHVITHHSKFHF